MRKTFDKINKSLDWITGGIIVGAIGLAIAGKIKRNKAAKESGVGDLTAWNKRHLDSFFERTMWNDKVVVYRAYEDDRGYIPVAFIYGGHNYAGEHCVISPNNIDYLKELCRIYHCTLEMSDNFPGYFPNINRR